MNKITPQKKPYAIVIGLDCFTGLQTARILSRRNVPVIGIAGSLDHACAQTNVCEHKFQAGTSDLEFIELLVELGPQFNQKPVLFPCADMSVLLISRNRQRLRNFYHIALPAEATVEMLMDKVHFYTFALKEGFPIPQTFFLRNEKDLEIAAEKLSYPCMLKPPLKSPEWAKNAKKVYKISSADELRQIYREKHQFAELLMAQEWIEGGDTSLFSLNCYFNRDGQPLATFIARKIRQWPIETGVSSLGEEVRNDEVLKESVNLFKYVNYHGLGYVEMKQDSRTGKHYIIEPNIGRPTGRSAISEAGGVELLYTNYCDMTGQRLPKNRVQKYGNAKWIYLRRDLQSAFAYWKRGDLTVWQWLKTMRGKKFYALFSWRDPKPFFQDLKDTYYKKVLHKDPHPVKTVSRKNIAERVK